MTGLLIVTHCLAFGIGVIVSGAYSSRKVREVKADALRLLRAQQVDATAEDFARAAGL